MISLSSCLWFNDQAEEAAKFYTSLFKNSKIGRKAFYGEASAEASGQSKGSLLTIEFEIEGQKVLGLNGGPLFEFNPSFSFFVWCDAEKEIDELWHKLSAGGKVRMGLDKYPWAEKYGFTSDKYGVEWQLNLKSNKQKITPSFLFVEKLFGKGEEAINFYMSVFKSSKLETIARDDATKTVMHAIFSLGDQSFVLMEGEGDHHFAFNNAFSLVVTCDTQAEIDSHWSKLSQGGSEGQCGWLTDKFGVSWQIVPRELGEMMSNKDSRIGEKVMAALLSMHKLDIEALKIAAASV